MGSYAPDTAIVIVGAGLAGLTTAMALGAQGLETVLIERRPKSLQHPPADGFTARTVEIFRSFGIGSDILPETAPSFKTQRTRVMSLTGQWFEELARIQQEQNEHTTAPSSQNTRHIWGPSRRKIDSNPFSCSVSSISAWMFAWATNSFCLAQDDKGLTVTIKKNHCSVYFIKASYLVAADGHRSAIRETLAIPRKGHGPVNSIQGVLFRVSELPPYVKRKFKQFTIDQPDLKAFMIAYQDERLVLHLPNDRAWTDESIQQAILQSIGPEKVNMEVIATSRWDMSLWIADEFTRGRVFLVGDAAHSLPPNRGGDGANTDIADGHNLAWKLAQVLQGVSNDKILSSYQAERLPVAWLRHDQIFARSGYKTLQREPSAKDSSGPENHALPNAAVEFGQIYRSGVILGADESLPDSLTPDLWKCQPGTLLPHCWI